MALDSNDIEQLKEVFATKDEMKAGFDAVEHRFDAVNKRMDDVQDKMLKRMDDMQDQMLRAFGMTEENIRQDCAHVDEVAAIDTRLAKVEKQIKAA